MADVTGTTLTQAEVHTDYTVKELAYKGPAIVVAAGV